MKTLKIGDIIGIYSYNHRRIVGKIDRIEGSRAYVGDIAFKMKYTHGLHKIRKNGVRQTFSEMTPHYSVVNEVEHPAYFQNMSLNNQPYDTPIL